MHHIRHSDVMISVIRCNFVLFFISNHNTRIKSSLSHEIHVIKPSFFPSLFPSFLLSFFPSFLPHSLTPPSTLIHTHMNTHIHTRTYRYLVLSLVSTMQYTVCTRTPAVTYGQNQSYRHLGSICTECRRAVHRQTRSVPLNEGKLSSFIHFFIHSLCSVTALQC